MSAKIVARRYAIALLEACNSQKADAAALLAELEPWAKWLASDNTAAQALLSPVLKPSDQAALLDKLLKAEGASALAQGFLKLALAKRRLAIVGEILAEARAELDRASGTIEGQATTAFALDDTLKSNITSYLAEQLGRKPSLTWREDPEIIGGFVVRIGDRVWDASLARQLSRLGETIRKSVR